MKHDDRRRKKLLTTVDCVIVHTFEATIVELAVAVPYLPSLQAASIVFVEWMHELSLVLVRKVH